VGVVVIRPTTAKFAAVGAGALDDDRDSEGRPKLKPAALWGHRPSVDRLCL